MATLGESSGLAGRETSAKEANHLTSKVNFCLLFVHSSAESASDLGREAEGAAFGETLVGGRYI